MKEYKIHVEDRSIVTPGDLIAEGAINAQGSFYREGNKIFAKQVSLVEIKKNKIKITPLTGPYIPKEGDFVIGKIVEVGFSGWLVDLGTYFMVNLPLREAVDEYIDVLTTDLSKYYDIGDIIAAKVINVPKSMLIQLSVKDKGLGKLVGGTLVEVEPTKVPRVIGREGSMVKMMKEITKAKILVGQNGYIWIKAPAEVTQILARAIYIIEKESHRSGLTDKIRRFLEEEMTRIKK